MNEPKLVLIPGDHPSAEIRPYYERAFKHWDDIWSQTFRERDGAGKNFSDNFTRQDEILAIFYDVQCVAMVCHRYVDFSLPSARNDSYFQAWPELAIEGLIAHGPRVLIGNQISVDPRFRGRENGLSLKDLVTMLSLWRLNQLDVDALPGTMRADKNMHSLLYACGAIPLAREVIFHNGPVDLIAVYPRARPLEFPPSIEKITKDVWDRRKGSGPLDHLMKKITARRERIAE